MSRKIDSAKMLASVGHENRCGELRGEDLMSRRKYQTKAGNVVWIWICLILLAALGVGIAILLTNERREDSGTVMEKAKTESLTCESGSVVYAFFDFDEATQKNLKITAIIDNDKAKSISLQYILYYNNGALIEQSESTNHAAMNKAFESRGLGSDALEASYAKLDNALRFGLYKKGEMTEAEAEFFLLGGANGGDAGVENSNGNGGTTKSTNGVGEYSVVELTRAYESLGMDCRKD